MRNIFICEGMILFGVLILVSGCSFSKAFSPSYLAAHRRGQQRFFHEPRTAQRTKTSTTSRTGSSIRNVVGLSSPFTLFCICIDCARVTNCAAYHFVESKHEQPHMTEDPTFEPREGSPTIHVNVRTIRNDDDRQAEIERMWKEYKQEERKAEDLAQQTGEAAHGETKYDFTPQVTYEYDVVACADYIEDKGCWVRNMPQEIREANPNFVPS